MKSKNNRQVNDRRIQKKDPRPKSLRNEKRISIRRKEEIEDKKSYFIVLSIITLIISFFGIMSYFHS